MLSDDAGVLLSAQPVTRGIGRARRYKINPNHR